MNNEYCVYHRSCSSLHSVSFQACHGNVIGFEVAKTKQKQKNRRLAIYRAWPWIWICWKQDPNSGARDLKASDLTTRPRCLFNEAQVCMMSCLLFLNQSVLANFDHGNIFSLIDKDKLNTTNLHKKFRDYAWFMTSRIQAGWYFK